MLIHSFMHEYKSITTKKKEILMLKTMVNEKKNVSVVTNSPYYIVF